MADIEEIFSEVEAVLSRLSGLEERLSSLENQMEILRTSPWSPVKSLLGPSPSMFGSELPS